jgi:protein-tyrosine phosphatase
MTAAARQRQLPMQGQGRQLIKADLAEFDLILAMDRDNFAGIAALDPQEKYADKIRLMCDFCTQHSLREVPDPYYGGPEGFNQVIDLLLDACSGLLDQLTAEQKLAAK